MNLNMTMSGYREFAAKFPEAHDHIVEVEMQNDLASLRRRGKKNLLNHLELQRLVDTEAMLKRKEVAR